MIRNNPVYPCSLDVKSIIESRSSLDVSRENRIKIFMLAVFAPLCLLMFAPSVFAGPKTKTPRANSRAETRTRRTPDKRTAVALDRKRSNVKLISKPEKRRTRETVNKRQNLYKREVALTRDRARRIYVAPNVRKTAMISSSEANSRVATRPALVNDIVIISEATPTPIRLSTSTRDNGTGNTMPSIWPVAGAIRGGFGMRHNPFGGSSSEFHKGQDISAPYGSQVIATADGVVAIAGWLRGYGQVVYVDHGNGISTRYGHLSRIDVVPGQTIKRGDPLGLVGSTGRSTGPHLHYEVRLDGQATNPIPYLPNVPVHPVSTKSDVH